MYKIDKKFFYKDSKDGSIDIVNIDGKSYRIGKQKILVRGKESYRGELPTNQELLKSLYKMGKEYVIVNEKPKKVKKVKDEPKNINKESEEVSIQKKKD